MEKMIFPLDYSFGYGYNGIAYEEKQPVFWYI